MLTSVAQLMINRIKQKLNTAWQKVKGFFSSIKRNWKKWFLGSSTTVLAATGGTIAVDNQINPYTETDEHYRLAVVEQLPEQGFQSVKFMKDRPEMQMAKWGGEVNMKVKYVSSRETIVNNASGSRPLLSRNVEWHGNKEKVRGYQIDDENYEFEVELSEKPVTNTFDFAIEGAEDLDFFYQPELTQEQIDRGDLQPENVVGSYAVYHKTKRDHRKGSTNYATGKAFHIYRPKAIDDNGVEEWAELSYQNGVLTVMVPQSFLDNAVYPVVVDPTFGYTALGSGGGELVIRNSTDTSVRKGNGLSAPEDGTLDSLSFGFGAASVDSSETIDVTVFVNETDSVSSGSHGEIASAEELNKTLGTTNAFYSINLSSESITNGTDYLLNVLGDHEDMVDSDGFYTLLYDDLSPSTRDYASESFTGAGAYASAKEDPWTDTVSTSNTRFFSIYATYTTTSEDMIVATGEYSGDGNDDRSISGIGFEPDFVMVKREGFGGGHVMFYTDTMGADDSKPGDNTANEANGIQALESDGFQVGDGATVNTSGQTYHYMAIQSFGDDFKTGSYTGDDTDDRDISVGFQPDLVIVFPDSAEYPTIKTKQMTSNLSDEWFPGAPSGASNNIQRLASSTFQVGSDSAVNSSTITYHWIAARNVSGSSDVSTYIGNGTDNRSITGVGFQPTSVITWEHNSAFQDGPAWSTETLHASGELSVRFNTSGATDNEIQDMEADGFQVGTDAPVNTNGVTYAYWALIDGGPAAGGGGNESNQQIIISKYIDIPKWHHKK